MILKYFFLYLYHSKKKSEQKTTISNLPRLLLISIKTMKVLRRLSGSLRFSNFQIYFWWKSYIMNGHCYYFHL